MELAIFMFIGVCTYLCWDLNAAAKDKMNPTKMTKDERLWYIDGSRKR